MIEFLQNHSAYEIMVRVGFEVVQAAIAIAVWEFGKWLGKER